jgi:uncharacterized protein (TIGR01777 family)
MKLKPKIVLAGGAGCLGRLLRDHFVAAGFAVVILSRRAGPATVVWDGETLGPWAAELGGAEAVVNLAGRSVDCRYTAANRRRIMDSRLRSTRVLGEAIARCERPPRVWLNASTATIYRHTYGPAWDEAGEIGACAEAKDGFSVEVATAWEREFEQAPAPHTRKVALRAAMVLSREGGVFPVLRRLARLGLGGRMGNGRQFVSWIHGDDFVRAVEWLIRNDAFSGMVNLAAPEPVPNAEFMSQLRQAVRMPCGLPATRWMLEAGAFLLRTETELIIKSRRVVPGRLLAEGFQFRFPTLSSALAELASTEL